MSTRPMETTRPLVSAGNEAANEAGARRMKGLDAPAPLPAPESKPRRAPKRPAESDEPEPTAEEA